MQDLRLFKEAKELCSYVMVITEKSPVKYRHTIVNRLHNLCLDVIENFYLANEVFIDETNLTSTYHLRRNYQNVALSKLQMIGFLSELAMKRGVILPKQFERITKNASTCQNLLGGWIASDKKRVDLK